MAFAKEGLTERRRPPKFERRQGDINMSYSRYRDDDYWDARLRRVMRSREGFAWGAFFIGFILGGIIF